MKNRLCNFGKESTMYVLFCISLLCIYVKTDAGGYRNSSHKFLQEQTIPESSEGRVPITLTAACAGTPDTSSIVGVEALCYGSGTLLSLSQIYGDDGMTYQWASSEVSGGPYTNLGSASDQTITSLNASTYYICTITCSNSGLSFTTNEKLIIVNPLPNVSVSPSSSVYCIPGGSGVNLLASNAMSYSWGPSTGLSATNGNSVVATPAISTTYSVVGTDANGCSQSVTGINVQVFSVPVVTAPNVSACGGVVNLGGSPSGGLWNLPNPYAGPATSYTYYYTDTNGCTGSASASINSFSATITGVNVTNITGVTASVNYAAVAGIGWYELRWKPVSSGMWTVGTNNNSTVKTLANLIPNTTYEVQIRGFCSTSSTGSWSTSTLFTTTNTCGTPTNLGITNIGATSATATWTAIANASYYSVRFRVSPAGTWSILTSNGVSLLLPNLQTNTLYDVQIATVCGTTYSPYSATVNFTTGTGCLIPTGMNVTNLTATSAKLNWNASTGAIYYGIRYRKTSVTTWTTSTSTGTSKTVGSLVASTPYEFQVQTVCSSTSSSSWSASTVFTTAASKPAPSWMGQEMSQENEQITFFPNPAHDFLYADVAQTEETLLQLKIIDVSGRICKEMQFEIQKGDNHLEADISDLHSGMYSVQIIQNDQITKVIRMTKN